MPRCPKGTRRNKKSGNCESKGSTRSSRSPVVSKKPISDSALDDIIDSMNIDSEKRAELEKMKPALKKMKYSKSYKSCFTGKSTRDVEDMIATKIQCWAKYGDNI